MSEAHVVWPSFCDLREEFTDTPEHCAHCGHALLPVVPQDRPPTTPAHTFTPFASAVADRRAEHRHVLVELAQWALTEGRHVDLDVAALCLDVLERKRTADGIHLDRRKVDVIVYSSCPNAASIAGTLLPEHWMEDLWTVLRFAVATGRLTADSDPEAALLEPLRCYGGLGVDGRPRPDGVDVDFFCQCAHPHDPSCPPAMVQLRVGRDWDEPFEFVVHAHGVPRSADVPMSAYEPLAKLAHGGAWQATRHRGRRRGFVWKPLDDRTAAHVCGLASWEFEQARREREQPELWDDDEPLRSPHPSDPTHATNREHPATTPATPTRPH